MSGLLYGFFEVLLLNLPLGVVRNVKIWFFKHLNVIYGQPLSLLTTTEIY